jgi:hypothetical protein
MKNFIWCLHCERTYLKETESDEYECSYPGCDGHVGDLIDWKDIRKMNTQYPVTPKHGTAYPM